MQRFEYQGQQISFLDQGTGEAILIVHGTPTNSSEYQEIIEELSRNYRCVAIDHLGFGQSEKPEGGDYSIQAHQDRLIALLKHLNLKTFHLVVHDFGGVIGLPLTRNADFKIKSVTMLNSWLWPLIETEPQMKSQKWLLSSGIFPFLYRQLNFSPKFLVKLGWGTKKPLSKERHRFYIEQFPKKTDRAGAVGFLRALFDFENPCWKQADTISKMTETPLQIIWGKSDKLISTRSLERWKKLLPKAQIHEFENVGHFVAEEAPEEVAKLIDQLIQETL
ncbi:Haloalkane dehalogenase [compost metagenome]